MGGLVESGLVSAVKYCKGVQHNYRLAKNTKKNELGTAHHNDASSTGYLITVTLHQQIKKAMFLSTHASALINFTYHEKWILTSK